MINREHKTTTQNVNPTLGVLTDTEVLLADVVQGRRVMRSLQLPSTASQPEGLLEHLWRTGLTSIWVKPATILSRTLSNEWFAQAGPHWVVVVHPDQHEPARPLSVLFWPKGSSQREARRLTLVFPEHAGWDWQLTDATSLLATITYLDQALARPFSDSPDLVAHQMLADLAADQFTTFSSDLSTLLRPDGTPIPIMEGAQNLSWKRPLTWVEERQKYLHKYTHLSLYLEACKSVPLGVGAPQYSANGQACDGIRPGIWRVSVEPAGSVFDGKRLPKCFDGEWMCTPQVRCCRDIGYRVQVKEGYFWPQSQDVLKRWASTLWQAAEQLNTRPQVYRHLQARTNVSRTIKMLTERSIAIIAQDKSVGGWARPDWWAQIVSYSRANLFTHLSRLVREGVMPVLVDKDAFWVVSNDPNPLKAVPHLVIPQRWRGYTVGYEAPLPLSDAIRDMLTSAHHADRAANALDTFAADTFP
ncbi:MAG TPA: hypothetical protein VFB12_26700 [Ktedonobacteraceae bacterium]|nr:hypothetical protein [Ktedonobacteraceae bacterium]